MLKKKQSSGYYHCESSIVIGEWHLKIIIFGFDFFSVILFWQMLMLYVFLSDIFS